MKYTVYSPDLEIKYTIFLRKCVVTGKSACYQKKTEFNLPVLLVQTNYLLQDTNAGSQEVTNQWR